MNTKPAIKTLLYRTDQYTLIEQSGDYANNFEMHVVREKFILKLR